MSGPQPSIRRDAVCVGAERRSAGARDQQHSGRTAESARVGGDDVGRDGDARPHRRGESGRERQSGVGCDPGAGCADPEKFGCLALVEQRRIDATASSTPFGVACPGEPMPERTTRCSRRHDAATGLAEVDRYGRRGAAHLSPRCDVHNSSERVYIGSRLTEKNLPNVAQGPTTY